MVHRGTLEDTWQRIQLTSIERNQAIGISVSTIRFAEKGQLERKSTGDYEFSDEQVAQRRWRKLEQVVGARPRGPSAIPSRNAAEKRYADVVVSAFYDCLNPEPVDYTAIREKAMPLPEGIPRIYELVGPTGVGKTRLQQHLLQTTKENFPMRGAGRTTVADTEVIVGDFDYEAVITFYSENEIREIIKENILEACEFAYAKPADTLVAAKLLVDPDKRFRFNFVLGSLQTATDVPAADDDDADSAVDSDLVGDALSQARKLDSGRIENYVERIVEIAKQGHDKARERTFSRQSLKIRRLWINIG